jgi:hypothetical protein
VRTAKDIGPFRGKAYREVEAQMHGNAPGGAYAVPVTLAFPKQVPDHNGFAIVDIVNTITIGREQWVLGGQPMLLARRHMGDDFLFGRGNVYVGVIWDKTAVEALGSGTIATAVDGYTILRDAATVARNPSRYLPAEAGTVPASDNIIAYGYSQTGNLLSPTESQNGEVARQFSLGATRVCFVMRGDSNRPGRVGWISAASSAEPKPNPCQPGAT